MSRATEQPQRRRKADVGAAGIVEVAERLFGEHGIEGVSLRQVAAAAGLANYYSVQYHFGDRSGLLRAIFESRLPAIDAHRQVLLDERGCSSEELTIQALLDCLCRPLLEMAIEVGRASFAQLLSQVLRNRAYRDLRNTYADLTPCGYAIGQAIRSRLPGLGADVFTFRIVTAFTMVLDAISDPSLNGVLAPEAARPEAAYEIAMAAALGCLCAESGNAEVQAQTDTF